MADRVNILGHVLGHAGRSCYSTVVSSLQRPSPLSILATFELSPTGGATTTFVSSNSAKGKWENLRPRSLSTAYLPLSLVRHLSRLGYSGLVGQRERREGTVGVSGKLRNAGTPPFTGSCRLSVAQFSAPGRLLPPATLEAQKRY